MFVGLKRTSTELESVWRMHVIRENNAKRDVWKRCVRFVFTADESALLLRTDGHVPASDRKVEQVTEEVHALRISLDKFGSREQRRAAEKADREELLSRADAGRLAKQEMDAEAQV